MKKKLTALLAALALALGLLPGTLALPAAAADRTYTVTANLLVPGELNTQLPGVTAYVTNPNNPLGVVPDNLPAGMTVESKAPTEPISNNATLTVSDSGELTLYVPLPNPVFTIQEISGCSNATIVSAPKDSNTYGTADGSSTRTGRVTSLTLKLNDRSGKYVFSTCKEFPTLLGVDWTVPLTLEVDLSGIPADTATGFSDVAADAYYADAVRWAVNQGVTNGTSATTFSPNATCTRGQIITFLYRAAGSPAVTGTNPFTDVAAGQYYTDACLWAAGNGMADGSAFQPNAPCTRAMAVEFLWKQAGSPAAAAGTFTDVSASASYAQAVAWAVEKGITNGTGATTFSPEKTCTRGQIATFLYRGLQ